MKGGVIAGIEFSKFNPLFCILQGPPSQIHYVTKACMKMHESGKKGGGAMSFGAMPRLLQPSPRM
jgi:hypothetical protein